MKDENNVLVRTIKFFITPYNKGTSLTKLDSVRISTPGVDNHIYKFQLYRYRQCTFDLHDSFRSLGILQRW
ncbi:hypothetical protein [Bacteroides faecalis]|uniref:hypothetical protein n=1 Tax=Bacteroides faecalis TaxID=2447885 RepID=UPI0011CF926A|nr:hypothetical protein [Bacteroides faecalis]